MIHDKTVWRHKLPVGPGPSSGPAGRGGVGWEHGSPSAGPGGAQRSRRGGVGRSWARGDRCWGAAAGGSGGGRDRGATVPLLRCCRHGAEQGRGAPACATAPRYSGAAGTALCPSTGRVPRCSALSRGAWGPLGTTLWDRDWCHWGTVLPAVPAPLMPHSSLSGGVPQLSQSGRGSEMTPHCSWQQHLPWPFWGSPDIQLHWEHLWERGERISTSSFVPGPSPRLGERYVGHKKYLAQPHSWEGSQPLRDSESLGQPPKHVPPKGPIQQSCGAAPSLGTGASGTCRDAWSRSTPRWGCCGPLLVLSAAWVPTGRVPV